MLKLIHHSEIRKVVKLDKLLSDNHSQYFMSLPAMKYTFKEGENKKFNIDCYRYKDKKFSKHERELKANGPELYRFKDCICHGYGAISFDADKIFISHIIEDDNLYNENEDIKYTPLIEKRLFLKPEGNGICNFTKKNKIIKRIEEPVFLLGRLKDDAYSHFVWDTLPLVWYINNIKTKTKKRIKILIPNASEDSFPKYKMEFLNALGVQSSDIIYKKPNESIAFTELYVGKDISKNNFWVSNEGASVLRSLREEIVSDRKNEKLNIVYFDRNDDRQGIRSIKNEDEIKAICKKYNAEIVTPGLISLEEKIRIFSSADILIGQYGGGMQNHFLCKDNAAIILLQSNAFFRSIHSFTSDIYNQNVVSIEGVADSKENNSNFEIDENLLDQVLSNKIKSLEAVKNNENTINKKSKNLVIDLDDTISFTVEGNYKESVPNNKLISIMRQYKDNGFFITIYTARNMRTYEGNVGKINIFTLPNIINWLNEHNVPYDEVLVGKPWCGKEGFYVDDKAIRPNEFVDFTYEEIKKLVGISNDNN